MQKVEGSSPVEARFLVANLPDFFGDARRVDVWVPNTPIVGASGLIGIHRHDLRFVRTTSRDCTGSLEARPAIGHV